jgi:hypothetical protein
MDYMHVSPELFQHIYFMCKYKDAKAAKSSRYVSSKGYLQVRERGMSGGLMRKSQVIFLHHEDVVSYFLGLKVSIEL